MKKLFILLLCLIEFIITGCSTTVSDIRRYEATENVPQITAPLDDLLNSKEKKDVTDVHIEAINALIRIAPKNNKVASYLDVNGKKLESYNEFKNIIGPYLFKWHISNMVGYNKPDMDRYYAEQAAQYSSTADPNIVEQLNLIITECTKHMESEKSLEKYLGSYKTIEKLKQEIDDYNLSIDVLTLNILNRAGINEKNLFNYTPQQIDRLIAASAQFDYELQLTVRTYESLVKARDELKQKYNTYLSLESQQKKLLKTIQSDIEKLKDMVSGNTNHYTHKTNKTQIKFIPQNGIYKIEGNSVILYNQNRIKYPDNTFSEYITLTKTSNPDYYSYTNSRYGFNIRVPAILTFASEAAHGGEATFASEDKQISLTVYGSNEYRSIDELYKEALTRRNLQKGQKEPYTAKGGTWFVVTWEENDKSIYQKTFLKDQFITTMHYSFPKMLLTTHSKLIDAMEENFTPGVRS